MARTIKTKVNITMEALKANNMNAFYAEIYAIEMFTIWDKEALISAKTLIHVRGSLCIHLGNSFTHVVAFAP